MTRRRLWKRGPAIYRRRYTGTLDRFFASLRTWPPPRRDYIGKISWRGPFGTYRSGHRSRNGVRFNRIARLVKRCGLRVREFG